MVLQWFADLLNVSPTAIYITIVIAIIIYVVLKQREKKYNLPPGPTPLPIVGNLLSLRGESRKFMILTDLAKQYGPIYRMYMGSELIVILNNIELALEATVKKSNEFAGRPKTFSIDLLTEGGKDIVFADFTPTWKLHRKIAYSAMKNYIMGKHMEEKVLMSAEKVGDILKQEKGPIDPAKYITLIVYNFITSFCWSTVYELDDKELNDFMTLIDDFNEILAGGGLPEDFIPILRFVPMYMRTRAKELMGRFLDVLRKKFYEHKDSIDYDNPRDFIDELLIAKKEAEKDDDAELLSQLTDTHLIQTLGDIFGAGTDTTRLTLRWCVAFMAKYPDIQAKVQNEIEEIIGSGRLPSLDDKSNMPFTMAVIFESMRLRFIVPTGVPHKALEDSSLGGYDIPKGCMIMLNHWAIHLDPEQWDEPDVFKPERFLTPDGKMAPKPTAFFPFSAGRRVCLGESIAKPELFLIFSYLMQQFKVVVPPGETISLDPLGSLFDCQPRPHKVLFQQRF